tara:strand:+ start:434 stop:748 length:315 start_codon:yes stop_codon:yes gene_type:complete
VTDVAAVNKNERDASIAKQEQMYYAKRLNNADREEKRWRTIEMEDDMDNQRWATYRVRDRLGVGTIWTTRGGTLPLTLSSSSSSSSSSSRDGGRYGQPEVGPYP